MVLDRADGSFTVPMPGETPGRLVFAPVVTQFIKITSCASCVSRRDVPALGLGERCRAPAWTNATLPEADYAGAAQAAANVSGAIYMGGAVMPSRTAASALDIWHRAFRRL